MHVEVVIGPRDHHTIGNNSKAQEMSCIHNVYNMYTAIYMFRNIYVDKNEDTGWRH